MKKHNGVAKNTVRSEKRAAAYLRMSTERQNYSLQHQQVVINDYALRHELEVVRIYVDSGKSGLRMEGRTGLKNLLTDVLSGEANFETILVYDVSRWGRFQDADESAYYEFICRRAGINVVYCAELFADDESPMGAVLKSLKRLMAGEFSRELSAKVFAAQSNFVLMGFKQGGLAGYGLRRVAVNRNGESRAILQVGERKSLQTDRIVLGLGPPEEAQVVQTIYDWYIRLRLGEKRIASMLNAAEIAGEGGRPWTRMIVRNILTNEKYVGNSVYNKTSCKLTKRQVKNTADMWIRKDGAFPSLISRRVFDKAQAERAERNRRFSDEELLQILRDIHSKCGKVSALLIAQRGAAPTAQTYKYHFGNLSKAYSLAGVASVENFSYIESRRTMREMRRHLTASLMSLIEKSGGTVAPAPGQDRLLVNGNLVVRAAVVRCQLEGCQQQRRWRLHTGLISGADFTVVAQLNDSNRKVLQYLLLPKFDQDRNWISLPPRGESMPSFAMYRFEQLEDMFR